MTDNTHGQVPEALLHASYLESIFVSEEMSSSRACRIAKELRRLHAYCQELESQVILDCMTHIQNHAENEHVAGDVSKNGAELNMSAQQPAPATQPAPQQEAQEPVAWESTTPGYIKYITQARYEKFSPNVQRWYKPYGCSGCAERGAGFDACDMATAAAQGFRRGQAAAKQEG